MNNLKKQIKMIAFDIDGTILPNGKTVFDHRVVQMFDELRKQGILTVLATAREFSTINTFLTQLKPDFFIGANGAFIFDVDNQKYVNKKVISKTELIALYEETKHLYDAFLITAADKCYYSQDANLDTWFIRPNIQNYQPLDFNIVPNDEIILVTISTNKPHEVSEIINQKIKENNWNFEINSSWSHGLFLSPKNVNKSSALEYLLKSQNLTFNNLMSFGDSSNDYEMLRDSFFGIAMQRANARIKSVSKDIAIDCEYAGTYLKLKELKLI